MGVGADNLCSFLSIKSFTYNIKCSTWADTVNDRETYSGPTIKPGQYQKSKLSKDSVSGFSRATTVDITVTSVTFSDGYTYSIPASEQETVSFSP